MTKKYVTSKLRRRARHVRNLDKQPPPKKRVTIMEICKKKKGGGSTPMHDVMLAN